MIFPSREEMAEAAAQHRLQERAERAEGIVAELYAAQREMARTLYAAGNGPDWGEVDTVRWKLDPEFGGTEPPPSGSAATGDGT